MAPNVMHTINSDLDELNLYTAGMTTNEDVRDIVSKRSSKELRKQEPKHITVDSNIESETEENQPDI